MSACQVCGNEFEPSRVNQKYCRDACAEKSRRMNPQSRHNNNLGKRRRRAEKPAETHANDRRYYLASRDRILARAKEWAKANPEKIRERYQAWKARHPLTRKAYQLKHNYNMSLEEHKEKLSEQGGVCAICGHLPTMGRWKILLVDHNHATGEVRGLLCHDCNIGIGNLKDNAARLRAAATYIERYATQEAT